MRMQKIISVISFLLLFISCFGQNELDIKSSENAELIKTLNSVQLIASNTEHYLSVKIYEMDNGTASAGYPSSEVTHNLLVAVSAFDEEPEQNLFEIGPFYNPKFISWQVDQKNYKEFVIEYGPYDKIQSTKLGVDLKSLRIINKL
ncbi:MAG: hypothetical protein KJO94_02425 [Eudoraea sp.]|nr:hypothetical protein [Eudoraea sp.]MBT8322311.1 hypothetical protein [Eudoraea sp.]